MQQRTAEQWEIIRQHIDFKGKSVIDLGCGNAEILIECAKNGAQCTGVEKNPDIIKKLSSYILPDVTIHNADLKRWEKVVTNQFDIAICFSVLPYLDNPSDLLKWMQAHSEISLIECQYAGDGPGLDYIENDTDMENWLRLVGWQSVENIGKTEIRGRNKYRTIWMCR